MPTADSNYLVGTFTVTIAGIAMAEVIRAVRLVNVIAGLWIIAALWILSSASTTAKWSNMIACVLIVLLSLRRGPIRERYGNWYR